MRTNLVGSLGPPDPHSQSMFGMRSELINLSERVNIRFRLFYQLEPDPPASERVTQLRNASGVCPVINMCSSVMREDVDKQTRFWLAPKSRHISLLACRSCPGRQLLRVFIFTLAVEDPSSSHFRHNPSSLVGPEPCRLSAPMCPSSSCLTCHYY